MKDRVLGCAAAACAAMSTMGWAPEAQAWYFPEHVVIAHQGLMALPPEVRDVLEGAVARARAQGLEICPRVDAEIEDVVRKKPLATRMVRVEVSVDCVPYSALSALAGDHASSAAELRRVLATPKGIEVTSAVAFEWERFEEAIAHQPPLSIERMSFVHELDVAFYFIDPGYELRAQATRAHFVDAGRSIDDVVRTAVSFGELENSLAQFLAHHLRSLGLASRGEVADAILEHAFAMHFLQDAFAAGHLVMTAETWKRGNAHARQRHDFYNARGLAVGRAMSAESCATLAMGSLDLSGLPPCWTTSGDGYLGISPDASDRLHAARAVTKAELQLALAIDSTRIASIAQSLGEREQLALGQLLDPVPWWTVGEPGRRQLRESPSRTRRLVRAAGAAIVRVRTGPMPPAIEVDLPRRPGLFDPAALAGALDPCKPRTQVDATFADDSDTVPCGPDGALALSTSGVSLLRPLLVEWPASQVDASTLRGESKADLGWAVQLLAAVNGRVLFPPRAPVDFFAPGVGVSAGLSYRWGTYLPGRVDRSVVELNAGISEALQYDSNGHDGGNPHVTMLDQELRWPVVWELLTSYLLPLDLRKGHEAGRVLFFNGVRAHELLTTPVPVVWGVEIEAAAVALSRGRGFYPLYAASPEVRLYVGMANPQAAQPGVAGTWGPTLGIELTGGYATFF